MLLQHGSCLGGSCLDVVVVTAAVHHSHAWVLRQHRQLGFISLPVVRRRGVAAHHGHFAGIAQQCRQALGGDGSLLREVVADAGDARVWRWRIEHHQRYAQPAYVVDGGDVADSIQWV